MLSAAYPVQICRHDDSDLMNGYQSINGDLLSWLNLWVTIILNIYVYIYFCYNFDDFFFAEPSDF